MHWARSAFLFLVTAVVCYSHLRQASNWAKINRQHKHPESPPNICFVYFFFWFCESEYLFKIFYYLCVVLECLTVVCLCRLINGSDNNSEQRQQHCRQQNCNLYNFYSVAYFYAYQYDKPVWFQSGCATFVSC